MNKKETPNRSEEEAALQKAKEFGHMSLTAKEHNLIGSTARNKEKLIENPDKNSFDLMSDEDILSWLKEAQTALKELERLTGKDSATHQAMSANLTAEIRYLESIGRLPEGFENMGG